MKLTQEFEEKLIINPKKGVWAQGGCRSWAFCPGIHSGPLPCLGVNHPWGADTLGFQAPASTGCWHTDAVGGTERCTGGKGRGVGWGGSQGVILWATNGIAASTSWLRPSNSGRPSSFLSSLQVRGLGDFPLLLISLTQLFDSSHHVCN